MSDPVSSIRNLGPATDALFARAGVTTAGELRDLGADAGYARLLASGARPHFIGYYASVMCLQGRPWHDCRGKEKDALRARFDAICATARAKPESETAALGRIEAVLNEIGVIKRA